MLFYIFTFWVMWEILGFLFKPTKTTEGLISKENNYKFIIIWILLFLYSLTSLWNVYFWMMWGMFDTVYYIKLFFYNIIFSIVFVWIVWIIWKVFGWKAKYLDILLVTLLAEITFIIVNIVFIGISLTQSIWLVWMAMFIYLPALIWFLVVWSKWLSKTEAFSETKVTFTVILSIVILYFWNSFLSWITWISMF
jgi:hypothetical protein